MLLVTAIVDDIMLLVTDKLCCWYLLLYLWGIFQWCIKETLTFGTTVKKLFKGKGIFFSRGYKAEGLNFVEKKKYSRDRV